MKKSLLIAAAALATTTLAGPASALDTRFVREIRAVGLPLQSFLGLAEFTALGTRGPSCDYLMNWVSPFNPNLVSMCILKELKTPVTPSCIGNAVMNITTAVSGGPGGNLGPTYCDGFDNLGIPRPGVTILAGEFAASPTLQGVAIYSTAVPAVLPIAVS
jgi:hypothetical protein